ncbi:hypothetical protein [Rhizobium sp. 007]|uniref:hypothetical protein n=1 Tax=Rhizobium sp. 007 TaxID=2785056 RepID=UPI00188F8CD4|nr:hypothetical protein [Rhizobium sp. 007]QPB23150.1 hypothetical protein ISN39_26815 [Rhizobium sp. 007]
MRRNRSSSRQAPNTSIARSTTIWGWAWSFRGITEVEVSVDGGASYERAALDERRDWAWQCYSQSWTPAKSVRAIDATGAGQPQDGARNAVG